MRPGAMVLAYVCLSAFGLVGRAGVLQATVATRVGEGGGGDQNEILTPEKFLYMTYTDIRGPTPRRDTPSPPEN